MKLNAPTKIVWFVALILGILGIVLELAGQLDPFRFWIVAGAWLILVLATVLKGF